MSVILCMFLLLNGVKENTKNLVKRSARLLFASYMTKWMYIGRPVCLQFYILNPRL